MHLPLLKSKKKITSNKQWHSEQRLAQTYGAVQTSGTILKSCDLKSNFNLAINRKLQENKMKKKETSLHNVH